MRIHHIFLKSEKISEELIVKPFWKVNFLNLYRKLFKKTKRLYYENLTAVFDNAPDTIIRVL